MTDEAAAMRDSDLLAGLERALGLLLSNESEAGLAAYAECIARDPEFRLPVGSHLFFLDRTGRAEAADSLRRLALRKGADISVGNCSGASPEAAAQEYRDLIRAGFINSPMINRFLFVLTKIGEEEERDRMLDYDRLLRVTALDTPGDLPSRVCDLILECENRAEFQESVQSVRNMTNLRRFHEIDDDAVRLLVAGLQAEVDSYLASWAASDHPLAHVVPSRTRLSAWALTSRGSGYNEPHIHHKGWATGVYYPTGLPDSATGGELTIGGGYRSADDLNGKMITIRPRPGLLVLFPSFYRHATTPLGTSGLRTSVAFDVIRCD